MYCSNDKTGKNSTITLDIAPAVAYHERIAVVCSNIERWKFVWISLSSGKSAICWEPILPNFLRHAVHFDNTDRTAELT